MKWLVFVGLFLTCLVVNTSIIMLASLSLWFLVFLVPAMMMQVDCLAMWFDEVL